MRLATSDQVIQAHGFDAAPARWVRPRHAHPDDVLEDPMLGDDEKRALLCAWASDASSVRDEPTLRWLLGTPAPVPLEDIRAALAQLDLREGADGHGRA
jgi:hypothetical protein